MIPLVILCGGKATRLHPLTNFYAKSMLPFWGKPFLQYQIELFVQFGFKTFYLATGHKKEQIQNFCENYGNKDITLTMVPDKPPLNLADTVLRIANSCNSDFALTYGDSFFCSDLSKPLAAFQADSSSASLMTVIPAKMAVEHNPNANISDSDGKVIEYSKSTVNEFSFINYGFIILRRAHVLKYLNDNSDLDLMLSSLAADGKLRAYSEQIKFMEVGSFSGLAEFAEYSAKNFEVLSE